AGRQPHRGPPLRRRGGGEGRRRRARRARHHRRRPRRAAPRRRRSAPSPVPARRALLRSPAGHRRGGPPPPPPTPPARIPPPARLGTGVGFAAGSLGTPGVRSPHYRSAPAHTSPDPVTLHRHLAGLAAAGVEHVAIEASSHGLDQRRLDGIRIAAGAFTNLTR